MGINLTSPTLNESLLVIDWDCGGDDGLAYVLYGVARVLRGQLPLARSTWRAVIQAIIPLMLQKRRAGEGDDDEKEDEDECDNIHSWISLSGDLAFSHQHGIYGFKFPKRFLEISSRDLTLFVILII
jgi:hypothetical protein